MENLENIKKNNQELYEKLQNYNCKMTYNNKIVYEGLFKEDIDFGKYNQSNIVCEFNINNNNILLLLKENENIDKLNKLFENKQFNDIYNDAKLFNKAMNLANNLPLYNFNKTLFEDNINKDIKKYGLNFQKIYENLQVLNDQIQEKLKVNSKSKVFDKDEQFYEKTSTDLLSEVQNEIDKTGEYHTYNYEDGKKKFKMGFLYICNDDEFIGIQAFNKASEFEDLLNVDSGTYEELDDLEIGDETRIDACRIIRIW